MSNDFLKLASKRVFKYRPSKYETMPSTKIIIPKSIELSYWTDLEKIIVKTLR